MKAVDAHAAHGRGLSTYGGAPVKLRAMAQYQRWAFFSAFRSSKQFSAENKEEQPCQEKEDHFQKE
jgi:hypothetical protein